MTENHEDPIDLGDRIEDAERDATSIPSDVMAEDLSVDDLVQNGADLMDLETEGSLQAILHEQEDEATEETIDQRILQEEPDPNSSIVPPRR